MAYDVVTCGSATVDMFAYTNAEVVTTGHGDHKHEMIAYPTGAKILIKDLQESIGGGGTNSATGLARMGLKVGFVGCLGLDTNAELILRKLEQENISFLGHQCKESTGYSMILDSHAHDRTILAHKGANDCLSFSKICTTCQHSRYYYFSSMLGTSFKAQLKIAQYAAKNHIPIIFNPSQYQVKSANISSMLKKTTVLIFNRTEAELLTGRSTIQGIMEALHKYGITIVSVTDGPEMCYVSDGITIYKAKPRKVKIVETTGAGDAYASAFTASYIKTHDIVESMSVGMVNAESVIQHHGAKNILLDYHKAKKEARKIRVSEL